MSSTAPKPTIVLIPGAWHLPSPAFDQLIALLNKSGYPTLPITLPSVGSPATLADDVATIRAAIIPLIEKQGKDVVMLMHSYGGVPGSQAVDGLARTVREGETEQGGVSRLVYISAMIARVGDSPTDTDKLNQETNSASGIPPTNQSNFTFNSDDTFSIDNAPDRFYNDLDPDLAKELAKGLKAHSMAAFGSKTTSSAYLDIPSAYLICLKDKAIGYKSQERMAKEAGIEMVEQVEAGHSPFLSMPDTVAAFVRRAAGEKC